MKKTITISFKFQGLDFEFTITPDGPDWWTSEKAHGFEFDIHYCWDYNEIAVYEQTGDSPFTNSVHSQKIFDFNALNHQILDMMLSETPVRLKADKLEELEETDREFIISSFQANGFLNLYHPETDLLTGIEITDILI